MKSLKAEITEHYYHKYSRKLTYMCRKYLGYDPQYNDMIQDCVQETFLLLFRNLNDLQDHTSIEGWLTVTCRHRLWNALADANKQQKYTDSLVDPMTNELPASYLSDIEKWIDDEAAVDNKEKILSMLNEHQQRVFLQYMDGYRVSDIASNTQMSESAVKSVMTRIRKKIKKSGILKILSFFL